MSEKNLTRTSKPWLSVVVPVYNAEKYLKKCLESIRKQSFIDYEVLLVDDGSVDLSSGICRGYENKDARFKYFRKENGGPLQTRIYGAERALGEYVTFCDADDYYLNCRVFLRLYNLLKENPSSAMQFGYQKKYNHLVRKNAIVKNTLKVNGQEFADIEYPKLLCSFWNNSHLTMSVWNKIYSKELIGNLPSSEKVPKVFWGDDLIMNLYLLNECNSFCFVPDILYVYRQSSGETNRFSLTTMRDLDNIKQYQLQFLRSYKGERKNDIESILYFEIAGWFYGYIKESKTYLDENARRNLIRESLELPRFQIAREYFANRDTNSEIAQLLKEGDIEKYMQATSSKREEFQPKKMLISFLKRIYTSI